MNRKTVFLVNPASANGATGKRWPSLAAHARELGLVGEAKLSSRPAELTELARTVDAERIVVVGGDGTVNEVVNGVVGRDVELAVIPQGTGKDFARSQAIPTGFGDAVRVAMHGAIRELDIGRATYVGGEHLFANVASVGMSGAIAKRANTMSKTFGGKATFAAALVREFFGWHNAHVRIRTAEGERSGLMYDVLAAIGPYAGGGMKLAPGASAEDGLLDVLLIGDVSKLDFVTTAPKLYRGTHLTHPKVDVIRTPFAEVDADRPLPLETDGEVIGTTPVRFEVVPRALRLRVAR